MDIGEYRPNSHRSREGAAKEDAPAQRKRAEKVVSSPVKTRKRGEMRKLADAFLSDDAESLKSYILFDVLVPTIKKAISEVVTNGTDMILYGSTGKPGHRSTGSKVSYGRCYDREREQTRRRAGSGGFDYDEIIFDTRGDAESVLDGLNDIINAYGMASVGDLYDLADVQTSNYAVNRYGWTSITGCRAVRGMDGYVLRLPRPLPLD